MKTRSTRIISAITLTSFLFTQTAAVAYGYPQIIIDGKTATTLSIDGTKTGVTTTSIKGDNAYNSFSVFDVNGGNTVNLYLPDGTNNLLNLVHDKASAIDGILNAYKGGNIGGNVYFANQHGFVIGANGVINTGSLSLSTPTKQFMDGFFDGEGNPTDQATNDFKNLNIPISDTGLITIKGQINTINGLRLSANEINNTGVIQSGAKFSVDVDLNSIVNTTDIETGTDFSIVNGDIYIVANTNIQNSGIIASNGGDNLNAGTITLRAGNNIELTQGTVLSANGLGVNSNGGTIDIYANNQSNFSAGEINANAGQSGDAGFIELSATKAVDIAGTFNAVATEGKAGTIYIDPEHLTILVDQYTNGANLIIEATESLTVNENVTLSTRQVTNGDSGDHLNGASTGDSGNLNIEAPEINIENNANLFTHAININNTSYQSGDISLLAIDTESVVATIASGLLGPLFEAFLNGYETDLTSLLEGNTSPSKVEINIGSANIKGGDVNIEAIQDNRIGFTKKAIAEINIDGAKIIGDNINILARADTSFLAEDDSIIPGIDDETITDLFSTMDATPFVSYSDAQAIINISGDTEINATNDVNISAKSDSKSKLSSPSLVLGSVGFSESNAEAMVVITDNTKITAVKNVNITAETSNVVNANVITTGTNKPLAVSYLEANTASTTTAITTENVTISATDVNLSATGSIDVAVTASATEIGASSAAISLVLSDIETTTSASLGGNTSAKGDINVNAELDVENNITRADASALGSTSAFSTKITNMMASFQRSAATSLLGINPTLANFLFPGIKSGKLNISGAIAINNTSHTVNASINHKVASQGNINIKTLVEDSLNVGAVSQSTSDSVGIGGAVALGYYTIDAGANIGAGSTVDTKGNINIASDVIKKLPMDIDFDDPEDLLSHITDNPQNLLFDNYAFNNSKGKTASLSGAVSVIDYDVDNTVSVGQGSQINQITTDYGSVFLNASNNINFVQMSGSGVPFGFIKKLLGKEPSKAGAGGSVVLIDLISNATAIVEDNVLINADNIDVKANSKQQLFQLAKSGTTTGKLGISGSFSFNVMEGETYAGIESSATINADDIAIDADSIIDNILIAGDYSKSGTAGIGASISMSTIDVDTIAEIGDKNAGNEAQGQITSDQLLVTADSDFDLGAYSVAIDVNSAASGGGGKDTKAGKGGLGVSGNVSINEISGQTLAQADGANLSIKNILVVNAHTNNDLNAISGAIVVSTNSSSGVIAGAYSENTINSVVQGLIENSTISGSLTNKLEMNVAANSSGTIKALAAGGAVGGTASLAGSMTINNIGVDNTQSTQAYIKNSNLDNATINLLAEDERTISSLAGAVSVSKNIGVGAAASINNINNGTEALFDGVTVTGANIVSVAANNKNKIETISGAIAVATSGLGLAGAYSANTITANVKASAQNSSVNASSDISLLAKDTSTMTIIAVGAGAGGKLGFGASLVDNYIANTVNSSVNNTTLITDGDINVEAYSSVTLNNYIAGVAVGGTGAVGGSVALNNITNTVNSTVNDAILTANRNINIESYSFVDFVSAIAGVAVGGTGAVGGSMALNNIMTYVDSSITSNAKVNAGNAIEVTAKSEKDITSTTLGASAAGTVALNGNYDNTTIIANTKADINNANLVASAGINIEASNVSEVDQIVGGIAVSGSAALGGSYGEINNTTTTQAAVQGNATLTTQQNVSVKSTDDNDIKSTIVAGGISGGLAASGAVGVINNDSNNNVSVNSTVITAAENIIIRATNNSNLAIDTGAVSVAISGAAGAAVASINNTINNEITTSDTATLTAQQEIDILSKNHNVTNIRALGLSASGVVALGASVGTVTNNVNNNANIGGNLFAESILKIISETDDELDVFSGNLSGSLVAAVGGSGIKITNNVSNIAKVSDNATLNSNRNINIEANSTNNIKANAIGGAAGIYGALGGAYSEIWDTTNTTALLGNYVVIDQANNINIKANTRLASNAKGFGGAVGAVAVGASIAKTNIITTTTSGIGNLVEIGQEPSKSVNYLNINAYSDIISNSSTLAGSGGIAAGNGSDAKTNINANTKANVGNANQIITSQDINILADARTRSKAKAQGVSIGGLAVGLSIAKANATAKVSAVIGSGNTINTGNDIDIKATHNVNGASDLTSYLVESAAFSAAGALVGGVGSTATSDMTTSVSTEIGNDTSLVATNNIDILARSVAKVKAEADGQSYGVVAGGITSTEAELTNTTNSTIGNNVIIDGENIKVISSANLYADANTTGGSGGLVAGSITNAKAKIDNTVNTEVKDGAALIAVNDISIQSLSALSAVSEARLTLGGLLTDADVTADTDLVNTNKVIIGEANMKADTITIAALTTKVKAYAKAESNTYAADTTSSAKSYVDVTTDNSIDISNGAKLLGYKEVNILSKTTGFNVGSISKSYITGFTGVVIAESHGKLTADSTIAIGQDSTITSTQIVIESETISAANGFIRDANATADTIINWVLKPFEVVREVTKWLPWPLDKIVEFVVDTIYKLVEEVLHSDVSDKTTGGDPVFTNSINLNGTLAQLSALNPELTINADGTITTDGNISATNNNGEIVINGIKNNRIGSINIDASSGTVNIGDNASILLNKTFEKVTITNNSTQDLRISNIDVTNNEQGTADLEVRGIIQGDFKVTSEVEVSDIIISGTTDADVILAGHIFNPGGSTSINNLNGDIYTKGSGVIESTQISLLADNGNIGQTGNMIGLLLVVNNNSSDLKINAGNNVSVNLQAIEHIVSTSAEGNPVSYVANLQNLVSNLALNVSEFTAGGSLNMNLEAGAFHDYSFGTEVAPKVTDTTIAYQMDQIQSVGNTDITVQESSLFTYNNIISNQGDIALTYQEGDAELSMLEAINGTVSVIAPGSILTALISQSVHIKALNVKLITQSGIVGTANNAIEIEQIVGGQVNIQSTGDVHIANHNGSLAIGVVSAVNQNVDI
ncbi:MAG: hypothetical protein COA59_15145, partial [Colwellia sp.]